MRTSSRLAVLTVVLLVPAVVATWSFAAVIGGQIGFANSEESGVAALRPVLAALAGSDTDGSALASLPTDYPELKLTAAVATVTAAGTQTSARTAALVNLVTVIGNNSKLILDPDLDSFYVMDAQVVQIPKAVQAAVAGANPVSGAPAERVAAQAVLAGEMSGAADALRSDVSTASANTTLTGLGPRLAAVTTLADAVQTLGRRLSTTLDHPAAADAQPVLVAAAAALAPATQTLTTLLQRRVSKLETERNLSLGVTLACLLLGIWLAAAVWWRTKTDVALTVAGVQAIAVGELTELPLPRGADELGDVGRSIAVAREQLAAAGEKLSQAQKSREDDMHTTFLQQRAAEQQSRGRAQRVVSETSVTVIDELNTLVAAVDAVRATADTIDSKVTRANEVTRSVVDQADQADRVVTALGESLHRVANMAALIAGVADQTRLLALNATIEAARAGEAGRGFSVVAGEVKNLAQTTARSTSQIASIIAEIERDAAEMSTAVVGVSTAIAGMNEATSVLSGVAEEQRGLVEQLDHSVEKTIGQVRGMDRLSETLERRQRERVPVRGPFRARMGDVEWSGRLIDLSETGVGGAVDGSVRNQVGVLLDVFLPAGDGVLTIRCRIARIIPNGSETMLGLEFVDLSGPSLRVVQELIADQLRGTGAEPAAVEFG